MKHCTHCAAFTRGKICSDCRKLLRTPRDPDYPWMFRRVAYLYNHGAGPKLGQIEAEDLTHLLAGRAAQREASPAFLELMETTRAATAAAPALTDRLNAMGAKA